MSPPSVSSSKSSQAIIESVLSFFKAGNLLKASKPGFSHALKLSFNTIAKERLSVGTSSTKKTLTYRYRLCQNVDKASVGLFSALMDELSTAALFSVGLPSPPGVSLQMQTELIDRNIPPTTKDIDIVNTVTKLGRKVSHTRTYFYCADTKKPLAYATHVKYMPTGSWFLDLLLHSKFLYNVYCQTVLARQGIPPFYEEKPLVRDVIGSHLEFHGIGRATFHMTREHTNPFGAMHGGCQAMIMEQVAESYAKEALKVIDNIIVLESLQIEFLAAVKGPQVEVVCETLGRDEVRNILHVRVVLKYGERVVSDGKLRFSAHNSSSPNDRRVETKGLLSSP